MKGRYASIMLDVSDVTSNGKTYNGNTKKFGITMDGVDYIIKFPKGEDMSVYCEYIASRFIQALGINCHTVRLALYKNIVVDMIQDFTSGTNLTLHSFKDTKQSSEDTDLNYKEYTYDDVLYLIDKYLKMSSINKVLAKQQFWDMFICDAIIGNRDRHWGNWGYLSNGLEYSFAPLYDNGAGLFPNVNLVIDQYMDAKYRYQFLYDRVFVFPASLFKIRKPDRSYRSNYAEMFSNLSINNLFAERVNVIKNNFNYFRVFDLISKIVSDVPLALEYRRFYIEIVLLRFLCIIVRMEFDKAYFEVERMLANYV